MSVEKRKALGRGLSALIPSAPVAGAATAPATDAAASLRREYFVAPIEDVHPSGNNPRRAFDDAGLAELVASIREHGIIEPLVVRARAESEGGGFLLIAGERRWRAAQKAGKKDVPVVVKDIDALEAFEMALVENLQRQDLNPIEEAEAYRRLCDEHGYTHEKLAVRVGKDRTTIANALRLLKLPPPVRSMVVDGRLAAGHARALLGLAASVEAPDEKAAAESIAKAADEVVKGGLSARQAEALVRKLRAARETKAAPAPSTAPAKTASVRDLEARLLRALGVRCAVVETGPGKGRLEIEYPSLDDLDRVLDKLLRP